MVRWLLPILVTLFIIPSSAFAQAAEHASVDEGGLTRNVLVCISIVLAAHLVGRQLNVLTKQTEAIGWLLLGGLMGNAHHVGLTWLDGLKHNQIFAGLAFVGVALLLIEAALETDLAQMVKNLGRAGLLAILGVAIPLFLVGFGLATLLFPGASLAAKIVIGGMVTPTSLGIAAKILKDQGILSSKSAQLAMNVAAIDDIIGLVVMALVESLGRGGNLSLAGAAWPMAKATSFMVIGLSGGWFLAKPLSSLLSRLHGGEVMKLTLALASCFSFGWLAHACGLSPLMGVYAGGVFWTEAHFKKFDGTEHGVEYLLKPFRFFFVPLFFVEVGTKVDLLALLAIKPLLLFTSCLGILVATKLALGKLGGQDTDSTIVGLATIPRGEVALVIATAGLRMHAIDQSVYAVCVALVVGSAMVTSAFLPRAIKRVETSNPSLLLPTSPSPHLEEALNESA